MQQNKYTENLRKVGCELVEKFRKEGKVPCGINGPYDDPETEVRYLAHLMVIAAIEYLKYGKMEHEEVVTLLGERVLGMKGEDGIYKMREKGGKDLCNGVIGHAWLIEGLLYAYKVTGEEKYMEESFALCLKHSFNNDIGLWGRPLMGRDDNAIDFTFNHQLWYAATLAELLSVRKDEALQQQLDRFMERLTENLTVNDNGRVAHSIYSRVSMKNKLKQVVKRMKDVMDERSGRPSLRYKETGYHVFNLMAFARIYRLKPDYAFFGNKEFQKTLDFVELGTFATELKDNNIMSDPTTHGKTLTKEEESINIYGYPYNVPGLELAYCAEVFGCRMSDEVAGRIMKVQMDETWDEATGMFGRKCHDKVAVNYRVYEFYRYLEIA